MQQILDIPRREWKSDAHHHRKADDIEVRLEVAKGAGFCHPLTLNSENAGGRKVPLTLPLAGFKQQVFLR